MAEEAKKRQEATQFKGGKPPYPVVLNPEPPCPPNLGKSIHRAAAMVGSKGSTVGQAKRVLTQGVPELIEKVEQGEISVNAAEMIATLPAEEQKEVLKGPKKEIQRYFKRGNVSGGTFIL